MFAHVQTSAGLLFCFMTISAGLPWHQGLWPQSLILSGVSKFQTLAESFRYQSHTPKCCHSLFPGHRDLWVQGNDLVSNHKTSETFASQSWTGGVADPALSRAQPAALALIRPRLSALLGSEESPSSGPEAVPANWSGPGFSCSACPWEGCRAGRKRVRTGGPAVGAEDESSLASSHALTEPHPGSRFQGCRAYRTGATRAVGQRTCPSGAAGCSGSNSGTSVACSSCLI